MNNINEKNIPKHQFISKHFDMKQHTFSLEEIEYLLNNHNPRNRPISDSVVNKYTQDIENERWDYKCGSNVVSFDKNGNLLNGQHRMYAHKKAKKEFPTYVFFGADPSAIKNEDGCRPRTAAFRSFSASDQEMTSENQTLYFRGYRIAKAWKWQMDKFKTDYNSTSIHDIEETLKSKRSFINQVLHYKSAYIHRLGVATCVAQYFEKYSEEASFFCDRLVTGADLQIGSPILYLREYIENTKTKRMANPLFIKEAFCQTLNSIHLFHKGESIQPKGRGRNKRLPEMWEI